MAGHRILIVEDETMIAMMIEDFLQELGWDVVGMAGTVERALVSAQDADIDVALLDVNLGGRDSFAVADLLSGRHVPFVFATGYGLDGIPDRFHSAPTLTKPFQRDDLERALSRAMTVAPGPFEGRAAEPASRNSQGRATSPGC